MGNSLGLQDKVIKIRKTDGKILTYKAPMKVHQILSEFPGHAISDALPVLRHLKPDTKLLGNHVYHLLPLPLSSDSSPKVGKKKTVRFANPEEEAVQESGVVRIKLVITKKELQEMIQKGVVAVDEMVSRLHIKKGIDSADEFTADDDSKGWKPDLESIPEVN